MSRSDILGYLGILLALPGFLVLFLSPYRTAAAVVLLLGAVVYTFSRLDRAPLWTVISFNKKVEIKDTTGKLATVTINLKVRPNHRGYAEYVYRGIKADGSCQNFRNGNIPIEAGDVKKERGEYFVTMRLPHTLDRWRSQELPELSYDVVDSFTNPRRESTAYTPSYSTKSAEIEVLLPEGRAARSPEAIVKSGTGDNELTKPVLSNDGRKITWKASGLKQGLSYIVFWNW